MNVLKSNWPWLLAIIVAAVWLGRLSAPVTSGTKSIHPESHDHEGETVYTCAMHPQIREPKPGLCPICAMELTPLDQTTFDLPPTELSLSPEAAALADLQTSKLAKRPLQRTLSLQGKLQINAQSIHQVSAHFHGRLETMLVSYPGKRVQAGDIIATVYAPALITAQQELRQAWLRRQAEPALYQATRAKLENWKIAPPELKAIAEEGRLYKALPIRAHHSGMVNAVTAQAGDHLDIGDPLFTLYSLENLWVELEAYQQQWPLLALGDSLHLNIPGSGRQYSATIDFIDPQLEEVSRVVPVRATLPNRDGSLKPGMFVRAEVFTGGTKPVLSIPEGAILWTGRESVVYRKIGDDPPQYRYQKVRLGRRGDQHYEVLQGLAVGDEVVSAGAFTLDAAAQLKGKMSMLTGPNESSSSANPGLTATPGSADSLYPELLAFYLAWQEALAQDAEQEALHIHEELRQWLQQPFTERPPYRDLRHAISESPDLGIDELRQLFLALSERFIPLLETQPKYSQGLYLHHCPMANENEGAYWLSKAEEIRNPYYGAQMLRCGSTIKDWP